MRCWTAIVTAGQLALVAALISPAVASTTTAVREDWWLLDVRVHDQTAAQPAPT
jgi:hypothetical protein